MSDRIDRDVINALIAGHFADPFSVLGMHKTTAGLEVDKCSAFLSFWQDAGSFIGHCKKRIKLCIN